MFSIYPIHAAVPATTALLVQRLADLGVRVHLAGKFGNHHHRRSRIDQTLVVPITPDCPLDSIITKHSDATFAEFCQWIFLLDPDEERPFLTTLSRLGLRLDSQVIVVTRNDSILLDHHRHLASLDILMRQDVATDSLQVDEPRDKPEMLGFLDDPLQGFRGARHSVFTLTQLYKLNASDAGSCVCLTLGSHEITSARLARPLPVERRNNFLGQVKITLGVLLETAGPEDGGADGHVPFNGDAETLLRVLPEFFGASISTKPIFLTSADGNQDIARALQNHEVDFVHSRIDVDVALERQISYSVAVYHEFRNVYLRQPELSEIRDIYLAPITTTLAVAYLSLAISLAVMLRLINNLHVATRWKRDQLAPRDTDHVSGSDAFLWFMGIFCMQGSTVSPNSTSSATIVITALLFQLIVYNAYSASITSKLSIYLDEVTNLHGLLHATDFEVGFVRNGSDEAYLVSNRDRDTSEILKRSLRNPAVKVGNYREGLYRAVESKFALFGRHSAVRGEVRQLGAMDFCELSEVQILSTYQKTAFAFRKDSPYKKLLNYEILRFLQHGIANREVRFMLPGMPGCSQVKLFNKAKLSDVFSCFAILLMGMANAFLVVLGEKFVLHIRCHKGKFRPSHVPAQW